MMFGAVIGKSVQRNTMKNLRINFRAPNVILEQADRPSIPIPNDDLPITPALRSRLEELSRIHAVALARNLVPSEDERTDFEERYHATISALEEELRDYGQIVDEVFPDVFEPWFGKEVGPTSTPTAWAALKERIELALKRFVHARLRRTADCD